MKAITICQPYAHLIVTPQGYLYPGETRKRVENRTWETRHRGKLLIHAGKSRKWLRPGDETNFPTMGFGLIVGIADLIDCVQVLRRMHGRPVFTRSVMDKHPWLPGHVHTEGPWCWILANVERFVNPIPYSGAQGLFDIPDSVIGTAISCGVEQ